MENKHLTLDETAALFEGLTFVAKKVSALDIVKPITSVATVTTASLTDYAEFVMGGAAHE